MNLRMKSSCVYVIAALALGSEVSAQSLELFRPGGTTPLHTVTLTPAAEQRLSADGVFRFVCVDADANNVCDGLSAGSGVGPAPTVSAFGFSASTPQGAPRPRVQVNETFFPTWASANAEVCVPDPAPSGTANPSELVGWGTQALASSGTGTTPASGLRFTAVPAAGSTVRVGIRCYGQGGRDTRSALIDVVAGTTPPPSNCSRNGQALLIRPASWTNAGLTWANIGGNAAGYPPNGLSVPFVLGQFQYLSVPFTARASENMTLRVVPSGSAGSAYEGFYLTISECEGDFRAPSSDPAIINQATGDEPTLGQVCRRFFSGEDTQKIFTTQAFANECRIVPGRTYHLNVIQAGGSQQIFNRQSTCQGGSGCGMRFQFEG